MNTIPSDLSPEATAWLHAQIAISTARAVAPLREEMDRLDDWTNGLFVVLAEVLPQLLGDHPKMAGDLGPRWAATAKRFDALQSSGQRRTTEGETLELLEARKMLYRLFAVAGVWNKPAKRARR